MQYDSRPAACGDGRDVVGYRNALFARNFSSVGGHWNGTRCVAGPVRVSLYTNHGRAARVQTQIGGPWPATDSRITDLGVVPSREAAEYFFSIVALLERNAGSKDRMLLPAVLAGAGDVIQPLLAIARDRARATHTRRQAIQWVGLLGDSTVIPALVAFAGGPVDDEGEDGEDEGLAGSAAAALGTLEGNVGIPALMDLTRGGSIGTRRNAVFWLGQSGEPRALRALHAVIENDQEDSRVRAHAIFSLAHGGDTPGSEFAYLRAIYPRLADEKLRQAVFQGMTEDAGDGGRWLIERARDAGETTHLRKNALFWAGQREATPTADLVSVYRDVSDTELRKHAIFVLSQRDDDAATDALLDIARNDRDRDMRGKALFWLAQKHDARVTKLISDLILK